MEDTAAYSQAEPPPNCYQAAAAATTATASSSSSISSASLLYFELAGARAAKPPPRLQDRFAPSNRLHKQEEASSSSSSSSSFSSLQQEEEEEEGEGEGEATKWQLLDLPEETLLHVFSFLDLTMLSRVELVCHHFRRVAKDKYLGKQIGFTSKSLKTKLTNERFLAFLEKSPNLLSINISGCVGLSSACLEYIRVKCPNLVSLQLSGCKWVTSLFFTSPSSSSSASSSPSSASASSSASSFLSSSSFASPLWPLSSQTSGSSGGGARNRDPSLWYCTVCKSYNNKKVRVCATCRTRKGASGILQNRLPRRPSPPRSRNNSNNSDESKTGNDEEGENGEEEEQEVDEDDEEHALEMYMRQKYGINNNTNNNDKDSQSLKRSHPILSSLLASYCSNLDDESIVSMALGCGNALRKLHLAHCHRLTDKSVAYLAVHCPSLVELDLSGCFHVSEDGIRFLLSKTRNSLRVFKAPPTFSSLSSLPRNRPIFSSSDEQKEKEKEREDHEQGQQLESHPFCQLQLRTLSLCPSTTPEESRQKRQLLQDENFHHSISLIEELNLEGCSLRVATLEKLLAGLTLLRKVYLVGSVGSNERMALSQLQERYPYVQLLF